MMAQKGGKIEVSSELAVDLRNMRIFYDDFAKTFASLNDYATTILLVIMLFIVVIL